MSRSLRMLTIVVVLVVQVLFPWVDRQHIANPVLG